MGRAGPLGRPRRVAAAESFRAKCAHPRA